MATARSATRPLFRGLGQRTMITQKTCPTSALTSRFGGTIRRANAAQVARSPVTSHQLVAPKVNGYAESWPPSFVTC